MKDEDLKKQKIDEAARRPGGRRKGQGEKYDPEASYYDIVRKAMFGKYAGTPFENVFAAVRRILGLETEDHIKIKDAELVLELFVIGLCKEKRWNDFLTLHSIFKEQKERSRDDDFRPALLYANSMLHVFRAMDTHVWDGLRCLRKKKESQRLVITKASILKEFRKPAFDRAIPDITDANLYKAMRAMGLPKEPSAQEMDAMIKEFERRDDEWLFDAEWSEESNPLPPPDDLARFHLLRAQLKALRDVSI